MESTNKVYYSGAMALVLIHLGGCIIKFYNVFSQNVIVIEQENPLNFFQRVFKTLWGTSIIPSSLIDPRILPYNYGLTLIYNIIT